MDAITLTKLFVDLAECKKKEAELIKQITEAVLILQETTKIAGITASYHKESNELPEYEYIAIDYIEKNDVKIEIDKFSTIRKFTRWKEVCEFLGVEAPKGAPKPARVVIKYDNKE